MAETVHQFLVEFSVANFTLFGGDLHFFYCLRLRLRFSKYRPASTLLHSELSPVLANLRFFIF